MLYLVAFSSFPCGYEAMIRILLRKLLWKKRLLVMKNSQTLSLQFLHQLARYFLVEIPAGLYEGHEVGPISCACPNHAQRLKPQNLSLISEI